MKYAGQLTLCLLLLPVLLVLGEEKVELIKVREWSFRNGDQYRDRNGDGEVDWYASGNSRTTDGYGIYKEDNDYDGFFDREFKAGGFAYQIVYDRKIREKIPPVHRLHKPTKITEVKRPAKVSK